MGTEVTKQKAMKSELIRLDADLPFTLRMLFLLDLLIYITIYIFIIADTFLISFTCIAVVRQ